MKIYLVMAALLFSALTGVNLASLMKYPKFIQKIENDRVKRKTLPAPEIIARANQGRTMPISLDSFDVNISVIGNIARTTLTMTFRNYNNAVMEGELNAPLAEGQTIRRFAMDVDGKLREGVPADKERARVAFESTVRKKIDPGVVESTRGNSFRARIYPIPAKDVKTVVVGYDQELPAYMDRLEYVLPFTFKNPVPSFTVRAQVAGDIAPQIEEAFAGDSFSQEKTGFALTMQRSNYTNTLPFTFTLPAGNSQTFVSEQNGVRYFYAFLTKEEKNIPKTLPKTITIVWDASGSGEKRQVSKELDLLSAYLKKINRCDAQTLIVRNDAQIGKSFSISGGNCEALIKYLQALPFDGATNLGSVNLQKYNSDEIILFTDGISNFGDKEIIAGNSPIYVISSAPDADHSYLEYISQKSGGARVNLLATEIDEALAALTARKLELLSVTGKNATDMLPSIPTPVSSGGIAVSGILTSDHSTLTLHYGYGGKETFDETITVSAAQNHTDADFLGALHAAKKITELDMEYAKNKQEITRLGKEFSIVTRNTSLIVLDRVEDYVRYEIMPPEDLRAEYNLLSKQKVNINANRDSLHLQYVSNLFNDRKTWYNSNPPAREQIEAKQRQYAGARSKSNNKMTGRGSVSSDSLSVEFPPTNETIQYEGLSDASPLRAEAQRDERRYSAPLQPSSINRGADHYNVVKASPNAQITLEAWDPQTPYMDVLKSSGKQDLYAAYIKLKTEYGGSAGFYLDVADFFNDNGQKDIALRILSNIAEINLENPQILRILGHRLNQLGYHHLAASIFRDILEMRGEEPQSFRDLALTLADDNKPQEAADMLYHLISHSWDGRFPEIELIAIGELNHLLAKNKGRINTSKYDKRLLESMPIDMRVTLAWDADNCDMDLWVIDPLGEQCYYGHRNTFLGGRLSKDLMGGYGPEEFLLKKAYPGKYQIRVKYYGSSSQKVAGPTTVQLNLFTRYAEDREEKKEITMRLKQEGDTINVGEFEFVDN